MSDVIEVAKATLEKYKEEIHKLYPNIKKIYEPIFNSNLKRRLVINIHFNDGTKKCTALSRVLLECKLGRRLIDDETCDHIDGNSLNDSFDNLQVLTRSENARKGPTEEVKIRMAKESSIRMKGNTNCPLGQAAKWSKLTNSQVMEIKKLQENYKRGQDIELSKIYNVSRSTIKAIRHGYYWTHIKI